MGRGASATRLGMGGSGTRNTRQWGSGPRQPGANRISPYGSKNSRNSSNQGSGPRKFGVGVPGSNANRPTPSYMRPVGDRVRANRSGERSGSLQRKPSPAGKLPAGYKPPHMRNNFVGP